MLFWSQILCLIGVNLLCISLCFAFRNLLHSEQSDFWTSDQFLTVTTIDFLSVVAYLRNLHSQLQAVVCILTGAEQTTVQVGTEVIVTAGRRLHCGDDLLVVGAAVVGDSPAGVRKHEHHLVELAEEAVQDDSCTVDCGGHTQPGLWFTVVYFVSVTKACIPFTLLF